MAGGHVVFLVNLLQDINIVRPLALLASLHTEAEIVFLVSDRFIVRDTRGAWQLELDELVAGVEGSIHVYDSEFAAFQVLAGRGGLLIAASESSLPAHIHTHDVMRVAPRTFLKVTLQHGFECVGFLQSREHDKAHGRRITFAADIICGWCDVAAMRSLAPSEKSKYLLTGPTSLLYAPARNESTGSTGGGLVCENLHSVRMQASGDFKATYMETFAAFCEVLGMRGERVTLRPHPGGQYVLKNKLDMPANVTIDNHPMYKVDLAAYAYGISAPSSVIIDFVLAGVPVAVWQDEEGAVDVSSYEGLTVISSVGDWLAFVRDVQLRRGMILERQARFLARSRLQVDRKEVQDSYLGLLRRGLALAHEQLQSQKPFERVMLVANDRIPTLHLSFSRPLAIEVDAGRMELDSIIAQDFTREFANERGVFNEESVAPAKEWIHRKFQAFDPTLLVICRYSSFLADYMVEVARERGIPVIFHIDDDLLNVPVEIGAAKHRTHNDPARLATIRHLLQTADLVYCSTPMLKARFRELGFTTPMTSGDLYCTGKILCDAVERPVRKIGYMGFDHANDLALILPAIVQAMRKHPALTFELFGSIPKPEALEEFGSRVVTLEPVRGYAAFLEKFASLEWDIGLCPLVATPFNRVKANTKWVEYTAVGAAVIASRGMAYDDCCSGDCGMLAGTTDEWVEALDLLCTQPIRRYATVRAAQRRVALDYSDHRLCAQVLEVFGLAHDMHRERMTACLA